jgi:hypothetical protein
LLDLETGPKAIKSVLETNENLTKAEVIDLTDDDDEVAANIVKAVKEIKSHFLYGCFNYEEVDLDHGEMWEYNRIADIEEFCNVKVPVPGNIVVLKFAELYNESVTEIQTMKNSVYLFDVYTLDNYNTFKLNNTNDNGRHNYFGTTGGTNRMRRAINKQIWIMPVYYSGHFSMIVVFNPIFGVQLYEENKKRYSSNGSFISMIQTDSLGNYHSTKFFQDLMINFTLEVSI